MLISIYQSRVKQCRTKLRYRKCHHEVDKKCGVRNMWLWLHKGLHKGRSQVRSRSIILMISPAFNAQQIASNVMGITVEEMVRIRYVVNGARSTNTGAHSIQQSYSYA